MRASEFIAVEPINKIERRIDVEKLKHTRSHTNSNNNTKNKNLEEWNSTIVSYIYRIHFTINIKRKSNEVAALHSDRLTFCRLSRLYVVISVAYILYCTNILALVELTFCMKFM